MRCPCHSGKTYAACCEPFHRNGPPAVAELLMRSRYAAFALGLGDYLVDTLASAHPDRGMPRAELVAQLAAVKRTQRFLDLCILHATEAEVLFYARIFQRGKDVSFVELSDFVVEDGHLRYATGILLPTDALPDNPKTLTLAAFYEQTEAEARRASSPHMAARK